MEIKVNCRVLAEQIELLDTYVRVMKNEDNRDLFEGISNLLSEISFAVEEDVPVTFVRCDEV